MMALEYCRQKVSDCLRKFLKSAGHEVPPLSDKTDLHLDLGLTSDEGLDLVLDLCELFEVNFPEDFNPVVHESGRRGMRLGELVHRVAEFLQSQESAR
jgi:acyl carrier protein